MLSSAAFFIWRRAQRKESRDFGNRRVGRVCRHVHLSVVSPRFLSRGGVRETESHSIFMDHGDERRDQLGKMGGGGEAKLGETGEGKAEKGGEGSII
ncbi:hypothetical protein niasHT_026842 [Heterodera trifolii]|uniref:Uncharacterized protein n=1 Tax=Heterodera trifolii TaxID=157864 RepID=A0ABD2K4C8_9BILA